MVISWHFGGAIGHVTLPESGHSLRVPVPACDCTSSPRNTSSCPYAHYNSLRTTHPLRRPPCSPIGPSSINPTIPDYPGTSDLPTFKMANVLPGGDGMMGQFPLEQWFYEMPVCTRWWMTAALSASVLVQCRIISPFQLFYSFRTVFVRSQVFRHTQPSGITMC